MTKGKAAGTKCYKIVTTGPNGLTSCYASHDYQMAYAPDVETVAAVGGLLMFATLEAASTFHWTCGVSHDGLWEVEALEEITLPPFRAGSGCGEDYPSVWDGTYTPLPRQIEWVWPPETKAFRRVKLMRRVDLAPYRTAREAATQCQ